MKSQTTRALRPESAAAEKASDTERRDGLTQLAARLQGAKGANDSAKVRTLAETVKQLAAAPGLAHGE